jgi:hypothetical protein
MKPLTKREYELASVSADLLCKGTPATRIAKYALDRGLNEEQLRTFLGKLLHLGVDVRGEVLNSYWYLTDTNCPIAADHAICFGKRLKERLKEIKRVP